MGRTASSAAILVAVPVLLGQLTRNSSLNLVHFFLSTRQGHRCMLVPVLVGLTVTGPNIERMGIAAHTVVRGQQLTCMAL